MKSHQYTLFFQFQMLLLLALFALAFADNTVTDAGAGCNNETDNEIECCAGFEEELWIFDVKTVACADIQIDWDTLDIELALSVNDVVLFDTSFGLDNPPALCTDWLGAHICLGLTDLHLEDWRFTGCVSVIIDGKDIDLGCWDTSRLIDEEEEA